MMICDILASIAFVLVGFSLHFSEGLHCWECNSKYDPNCGNPFQSHTISLADCGQRYLKHNLSIPSTVCRKITQKVQSETRVIRSCGFYNPEDAGTCITRAGTHLVFMHYCTCAGEGCNASNFLQESPYLLFVHLLILAAILS